MLINRFHPFTYNNWVIPICSLQINTSQSWSQTQKNAAIHWIRNKICNLFQYERNMQGWIRNADTYCMKNRVYSLFQIRKTPQDIKRETLVALEKIQNLQHQMRSDYEWRCLDCWSNTSSKIMLYSLITMVATSETDDSKSKIMGIKHDTRKQRVRDWSLKNLLVY